MFDFIVWYFVSGVLVLMLGSSIDAIINFKCDIGGVRYVIVPLVFGAAAYLLSSGAMKPWALTVSASTVVLLSSVLLYLPTLIVQAIYGVERRMYLMAALLTLPASVIGGLLAVFLR